MEEKVEKEGADSTGVGIPRERDLQTQDGPAASSNRVPERGEYSINKRDQLHRTWDCRTDSSHWRRR